MILSGKKLADELLQELALTIKTAGVTPRLAVILVGDHPASVSYIKTKQIACKRVGIETRLYDFPEQASESHLLDTLNHLNFDPRIDGILLQLPLPLHLESEKMVLSIDPSKDVDGFHPLNMGKLLLGRRDGFIPCTPLGIQTLLTRSAIETQGKRVVVVGRSDIVGKPLAALLMQKGIGGDATVTVAHSRSPDLKGLTRSADIVVAAIGKPHFITGEMISEGACVIDVGINRIEDTTHPRGYRLVGDVHFDEVAPKCQAITPVPGGVGPLTVAMLLENVYRACEKKCKK